MESCVPHAWTRARGCRPTIVYPAGKRTAVNLPPPSSVLFGAQHMRMLEATQARIPQIAPTMPGVPPAKPIIEKTELPRRRCARESRSDMACACAKSELS